MNTISIHGKDIPITTKDPDIDVSHVLKWTPFVDWTKELDPTLDVRSIDIQSVDMFGNGKIGFVKFKSLVYRQDIPHGSKHLPGIVFMRGPSVAILIVLKCKTTNMRYTALVEQARVPIGFLNFLEIPAGVLEEGQFKGIAAKELKEEVGIEVKEEELIDLIEEVYGNKYKGMYPSPGGCDEYIKLYALEQDISEEELEALRGRLGGVSNEGEYISVNVMELEEMITRTVDAKALGAYTLYQYYLKKNKK